MAAHAQATARRPRRSLSAIPKHGLLLVFFNNPHGPGLGRLQPIAMERTIRIIDNELDIVGLTVSPPCDQDGTAR